MHLELVQYSPLAVLDASRLVYNTVAAVVHRSEPTKTNKKNSAKRAHRRYKRSRAGIF